MSRSLIARRALMRDGCVDGTRERYSPARIVAEIREHLDELGKRRRIKRQIREERRPDVRLDRDSGQTVDSDSVSIVVRDRGPYVHYPASEDDLRAVMRRLPPDALLGISGIELRLEPSMRPPGSRGRYTVEPDPYLGRMSVKALGGVWVSPILASYSRRSARVSLQAYVHDPAWEDAGAVAVALKYTMLQSLMHELAHHDDRRRRVARGRWIMDDRGRAEAYAEQTCAYWTATYVLPYLLDRYGEGVDLLGRWVAAARGRPALIDELTACPFFRDVLRVLDAHRDADGQHAAANLVTPR